MTDLAAHTTAPQAFPLWRAGLIVLVLCAAFGAVIHRAYVLQVVRGPELSAEAVSQLEGTVEIRARRGAIYDRHANEMAVSVRAESIFARPHEISAPRDMAVALAPILGRSQRDVLDDLTHDGRFRWLARRVSPAVAQQVRALELSGIETVSEWHRFYPMRYRAGHLLGFTGDDGFGLEGLERQFDDILTGGAMEVHALRDARGRPILSTDAPALEELEGASILLTLDARIQRIAEREIEAAVLQWGAHTGVAVVLDPMTGDVLAMTNWPLFDPNSFRTSTPLQWRNRAITDTWEPGSTAKVFTYALALEAGVVEPDTAIDCAGGRLRIGAHRIRDTHHAGMLRAWEVVQQSSNIGAYRMAQLLGATRMYQGLQSFGLGQRTALGWGGEQPGRLPAPRWAEIELANRAFGQGLTATPLQLALAFSAIANGGELMVPRLILETHNKDGVVIERTEPIVQRRVISETTARRVTEAMIAVTERPGTGSRAAIPGILVAGKTGTAQKVDPETGQYADLWMASFIGFVPADEPLFTIVVMIDEPQGGHYGGELAAPVFARIAEQALQTRGIFVERPAEQDADLAAAPSVDEPDVVGPAEGGPRSPAVTMERREGRVGVPDFSGLTLLEALVLAENTSLGFEVHDWGTVRHQWPAPGMTVLRGTQVELYLGSPYTLSAERGNGGVDGL